MCRAGQLSFYLLLRSYLSSHLDVLSFVRRDLPIGIDIDWEYPGYAEHSGTTSDRDNFNLLLSDVRAKLDELGAQTGKFYGLTAALPCGPSNIANMDIAHVASTLSELNLMTYGEFLQ